MDRRCHSLCGSVDWNPLTGEKPRVIAVTPYVGVWIETIVYNNNLKNKDVTPYVGVWIETSIPISIFA